MIKRLQGSLCGVVSDENFFDSRADVIFIRLVDGIVCQVHECLLVVRLGWRLVASRAEAGKTLIAKESLNRVKSRDYNVDSQVKLNAIEKQWAVQVPLHDNVVPLQSERQFSQLLE